ncbi:MAG: peroxiredoxin [Myxococcota bacterium]|jgi:peroxiredoxin
MRSWWIALVVAHAACVPEFKGQGQEEGGFEVGRIVPDVGLPDQAGEPVSLRDFDGSVVLLDISTMWCAPCQELATHAEATFADYEPDGFMYITVLQEDVEGGVPKQPDLQRWADSFSITTPVLADGGPPEERTTGPAIVNGQFPAILVIGRDGSVVERVGATDDASVREAIERAL